MLCRAFAVALGAVLALPDLGVAQPLGTFRWQLQPYCNVVTVAVTQNGSVYRMEGTDDQCGATVPASVIGTATLTASGAVSLGLNIVSTPGGVPNPVSAEIAPPSFGGPWRDAAGHTGTFALTPGAGTGGAARPLPSAVVPPAIHLDASGALAAQGTLGSGAIPASGPGVRMMWHPAKAAFRAGIVDGEWDDPNIGIGSAAFGLRSRASGVASFAAGEQSIATGYASFAVGYVTAASGAGSAAFGSDTFARGYSSAAFGRSTQANGESAVAIGAESRANGVNSLAAGVRNYANGYGSIALGTDAVAVTGAEGSFVFSDRSGGPQVFSLNPNEFVVRASGGTTFFSNKDGTAGVHLAAGGWSWSNLSDANSKHEFAALDGEAVLARLATMPVTEWSYKAQDASIRHAGPTAQDFHAAFGLGEDPLRISTIDADGVALAGVKALEARTRALLDENAALRQSLEDERARMRAELQALSRRLDAAESAPTHRPRADARPVAGSPPRR